MFVSGSTRVKRTGTLPHSTIANAKRGPSLLQTLQRVADETPSVLYTGDLAAQLAADVRNAGGIMTAADLASYSPRIREPLRTTEMGEASLQRVFLFRNLIT
jgi:gamma-glutamyltranspeptidase